MDAELEELLSLYRTMPEDKQKWFMEFARELAAQEADPESEKSS
jgi:hypothetical protein